MRSAGRYSPSGKVSKQVHVCQQICQDYIIISGKSDIHYITLLKYQYARARSQSFNFSPYVGLYFYLFVVYVEILFINLLLRCSRLQWRVFRATESQHEWSVASRRQTTLGHVMHFNQSHYYFM